MSLESNIAELVKSANGLTDAVHGKIGEIDQKVGQKITELNNWRTSHWNEHPAIAVNFNAKMTAVGGEGDKKLPLALGVHAGGDFWGKFDAALIPVTPGEEPASRPPIVRELLQYMKSDDRHFSANFNILHLTVKKVSDGFGPYVFFVPYQHVKMGAFTSVALYHKVIGQGDWNWMDNSKKGVWNQATHHFLSAHAGAYTHVDIALSNAQVGDQLYLALPQIIPGVWNPELRLPQLYNIFDPVMEVIGNSTISGLGGVFSNINNSNR